MADKVLMVGINKYRGAPLRGCVNDVIDMASYLVQHHGFKKADIRLLTDKRATTNEILARLDWLVKDAQPGDRLFFHFSGHGVQVATRDPQDEIDGLDEVICPVEFDWSEEKMIRDKQLRDIFSRLPSGVKFCWVNDSCHSGTLTRDIWTPRTIPAPVDLAWRAEAAKEKGLQSKGLIDGTLEVGFISGCQSDQTSADAYFSGRYNGALTYYLIETLKQNPGQSIVDVVAIVNQKLAANRFTQRPQAEGTRIHLPFLG